MRVRSHYFGMNKKGTIELLFHVASYMYLLQAQCEIQRVIQSGTSGWLARTHFLQGRIEWSCWGRRKGRIEWKWNNGDKFAYLTRSMVWKWGEGEGGGSGPKEEVARRRRKGVGEWAWSLINARRKYARITSRDWLRAHSNRDFAQKFKYQSPENTRDFAQKTASMSGKNSNSRGKLANFWSVKKWDEMREDEPYINEKFYGQCTSVLVRTFREIRRGANISFGRVQVSVQLVGNKRKREGNEAGALGSLFCWYYRITKLERGRRRNPRAMFEIRTHDWITEIFWETRNAERQRASVRKGNSSLHQKWME